MKKILALCALCVSACFASAAFAAAPESASASAAASGPKAAQQTKMATCNADAAGKKGDERKAFMKECLSNKPAAATAASTSIATAR